MKYNYQFVLITLFFFQTPFSFCQNLENTSKKPKKIKILPVPTFGYEPETNFYIGAVSLFTINLHQDSLTRVSNAKLEFTYTTRNQIIFGSEWNYFSKNEEWFSDGIIHVSRYPDFYYGIGADVTEEEQLLFESNRVILDIGMYKKIKSKLFLGSEVKYIDYFNISAEEFNPHTELQDSWNIGLSGTLFYDSRNNLLNSTKGSYMKFNAGYNYGSQNYVNAKVDLRKYYTFKHDIILATRFYNSFIFGTPNFYDYSILGGDDYVRGYFYGKYRDHNLSTFQTEVRTPTIWRLGLAFISGISSIYNNSNFIEDVKPNYGIGLRILADKKDNVNLRFDYVLGNNGNSGFYVSFGESF